MSDLISREKTLNEFRRVKNQHKIGGNAYCFYRDLANAIKVMPSEQEWVPVTDRLPEENVRVLVTRKSNIFMRDNYIDIGRYTKQKRWETADYVNVDVFAWKPLPEPFEGGDCKC